MKKWKQIMAAAASVSLIVPGAAFAEVPLSDKEAQYKTAQVDKQVTDSQTLVIKYSGALPESVHKKAGVSVIKRLPGLKYDVVQVPKSKKLSEVISVYKTRSEVRAITPSIQYKAAAGTPDPKASRMNHLAMLNMGKALSYAGKNNVTIAVVDSGVDYKHPDLKANLLKPYNVVNPARNPVRHMHGTHVAGIISSLKDNGLGGYGIFPNAKILPVDVFNGSETANDFAIAEGITYSVDQGADVINLSLESALPSAVIEEAVQYAIDSGAVVVAAAGNGATDQYAYPAAYPGVISVGNINGSKTLSDSSNYGASVDVVAPGEDIYSTYYDAESGSKFERLTGTSMASPMVAAAAGLLKSKYPDLTAFEIEYILEQTATDLGEKGYDLTYGNGLINPLNALKFDIKKLPKRPQVSGEEILKTAKEIKEGSQSFKGAFKSPGTMHWFKANVTEGQHVQTVLDGSKGYDYALELYFIPEGGDPQYIRDVDRTLVNGQEGYLYTASEAGTLVIGVKDANGNYNAAGKSAFTLQAEKLAPITPDQASPEQPVAITSLPYTKNDFTLYSGEPEMPDSDYFTLSVDEEKLLSLSVSALPGVDSAINVYMKEGEEEYSIVNGNNYPVNEGETVSFQAVPGAEYKVEVTNGAFNEDIFFGSITDLLSLDASMLDLLSAGESAAPYTFKVEERTIPVDEDGLPEEATLEDSLADGEITPDEYGEMKEEELIDGEEEPAESGYILEKAVPYTVGSSKQGYFQFVFDEDYYRFVPNSDGIYSFEVKQAGAQPPSMTIMETDPETGELIPVTGNGGEMDLISALLGGLSESGKVNVALKKGKSYILQVLNNAENISADPYTIQSKRIANLPAEKDSDANLPENGLNVTAGKAVQNYFIQSGDMDYYYFMNGSSPRIYTLDIAGSPLTASQKAGIPLELRPGHIFSGGIAEDTNGDKILDEEEMKRIMPFGPDFLSLLSLAIEPDVHTSFAAKEGTGYFIQVAPFLQTGPNLQPYEFKIGATYNQTKDGDGKVTNHVPAKPLALKTTGGKYGARGYFNTGLSFGDTDHFALNLKKESSVSISLSAGKGLDGVIEIYNAKGTLVSSFDHYGKNDEELANLKLAKGTYYIEVSEANGTASTVPYELIVKK
ncbi:S8 family serine peptidase [Domibacillus indicus]|uniref:S8 family serine peptidase n=1 Tax=Domibacillus indicus TaxID=1437523 RepID=UPI0006180D0E|nr:S8 family serine peptidase [Domibacillus indicus]